MCSLVIIVVGLICSLGTITYVYNHSSLYVFLLAVSSVTGAVVLSAAILRDIERYVMKRQLEKTCNSVHTQPDDKPHEILPAAGESDRQQRETLDDVLLSSSVIAGVV